MDKINLIIDGNFLLTKNAFIAHKNKILYSELETIMVKEIKNLSDMYAFDNIYFISDDKNNWRKKFYTDYKAKRSKDSEIDWPFVYETYENFKKNIINFRGIKQLQVVNAEGDDLIAYVVRKSNEKGFSNLIISVDGDLYQLLDYDINKGFINIMLGHKMSDDRIHLPENYKVFLDFAVNNSDEPTTLFNMSDDVEMVDFLKNITHKGHIVEKNKEAELFIKIISGDKGDNITSVYESMTTTGKPRGIGTDGAKSLYDLYKEIYPEDIDFNSKEIVERIKDVVCSFKKVDPINVTNIKNLMDSRIKRNLKLIVLNDFYAPEELLHNMENSVSI
jgi:5'-3' exonuclease